MPKVQLGDDPDHMRLLVLKDTSIPDNLFTQTIEDLMALYTEAGVSMVLTVEPRNFLALGQAHMWENYYDGYYGIKQGWLRATVQELDTRLGKKSFDHVVFAVDARNWYGDKPVNKVWGWNISAGILGYDVQQVRFDTVSRNFATQKVNSVGTLYHELMHSHMHFPFRVFYGAHIERNLPKRNISHWGNQVVHGEHPDWKYIRHNENLDALKAIAPVLRAAYETRIRQFSTGTGWLEAAGELTRTGILKATAPFAEW